MAEERHERNPPPGAERGIRQHAPRSLGELLPAITRPAYRRRSPAGATLMAEWGAIVGPALALASEPRRLAAGTLTIACDGPVALELQHLAAALTERINTHVGQALVRRLAFVQAATAARPPLVRRARPAVPPAVLVEGLPDGALRQALEALGGALALEAAGSAAPPDGADHRLPGLTRRPRSGA